VLNAHQKYRQNQVETADPAKLLLMLFDGGRRFLRQAEAALEKKDLEQVNHYLGRAQGVIAELMASLDLEQGEVAANLFRLYEYMHYRLVEANLKKTKKPLQEVDAMLATLRDTWKQVSTVRS
jgi:flagellar protein FliS